MSRRCRALRMQRIGGRGERGQSLVEFALVFPIFLTLVLSVIEFALLFNATLAVNYAARDGALAGAEAGNQAGSDCVILKQVDAAVSSPADRNKVTQVQIYKATANGVMIGSPTTYARTATPNSTLCVAIDGSSILWTRTANGYPELGRCNFLLGCGGSSTTVDNIAVKVFYAHNWATPLRNFIGGGAGGFALDRSSVMRMEPVL